jgi:hypothetical protein
MEVVGGVGVIGEEFSCDGGEGWQSRAGRIAQKRGQTALSAEDGLLAFEGLWVGDRVVSPLFCAALF